MLDLLISAKPRLNIFWLRDGSLEASYNLPCPDVLAHDLEAASNNSAKSPLIRRESRKQEMIADR